MKTSYRTTPPGPMSQRLYEIAGYLSRDPAATTQAWGIGAMLAVQHPEWVQAWLREIPDDLREGLEESAAALVEDCPAGSVE